MDLIKSMFTSLESLPAWAIVLIILAVLWTIPWKGIALWKAARLNNKGWFIALLIINTLGILEILYIYIYAFSREREKLHR